MTTKADQRRAIGTAASLLEQAATDPEDPRALANIGDFDPDLVERSERHLEKVDSMFPFVASQDG